MCMDKLLKGERKKHNNYSILIIICTDDTHKQMNHTTTVFYQFISQSIYLPVFVGGFFKLALGLITSTKCQCVFVSFIFFFFM